MAERPSADKSPHSLAAIIQLIVNSDNGPSTVNFKFQNIFPYN